LKRRELRLWGREYGPFTSALSKQAGAFSDGGGPLELDLHLVEISELEHRLLDGSLASSGEADVLLLNTDWLPGCLQRGLLLALDEELAAAPPPGWPDAWAPALRELQQDADGHVYGLAYHDGPMMLMYRRDLFEDARRSRRFDDNFGRPLAPAKTWDDFMDQAHFFTDPGAGSWGTIFAGFPDAHNNVYDFLVQLWGRGGDVVDAAGMPVLGAGAAGAAAQWLADLWHRQGVVDPAAAGWDSVASGVHFAAGEAAQMVNWCGFASLAADPASPTHGLLACAPAPEVAGRARVTMNSYWVLAVPRGSREPELAWAFLRHTAGEEMDRLTAVEGATAVRRDTWSDPEIQKLAPYYSVLEDAHKGSRSVWRDPRWPAVADVLNDAMADLVVRRREPRAALLRAQQRLEALLGAEGHGAPEIGQQ
jgi:multiple sugar transport system substrate-binding protein